MPNIKLIHGIDLTAPGGLDALFAYRRAQFGDAQMNANAGGDGDPAGTPAGTPAGEPAGTPAPPATPATPPPGLPAPKGDEAKPWDGKIESLDPAVQKVISDLRKESGDERVAKKTLDAITKALNPDATDGEKPTAEQLTAQLTEQATDAKQARTELAVYKLAGKAGADADALLDSRAFLAKLAALDHNDTKAVTKAITDAITENPKLKAVLAAGKSGADFSGGSGEQRTKKSVSLAEAAANHYGTK
ncbi:hypothetical protein [Glutamicibacter arilaitensis]|uniref:hypothetical protein n=1 Tax=Glutamicibacter arilaitensis TaxID=256701 RepID=UPI00384A47E4